MVLRNKQASQYFTIASFVRSGTEEAQRRHFLPLVSIAFCKVMYMTLLIVTIYIV